MITNNQIIYLLEEFKIPYQNEFCPEDWKDWYHYILYNSETQIRFLYNLCFNGKPGTGYITETVLITLPKFFMYSNVSDCLLRETYGYARNIPWKESELKIQPLQFSSEGIFFNISNNNLFIRTSNLQSGISVALKGKPIATPVFVPELSPYGNGFIGWGVIPGYEMTGKIIIGKKVIPVDSEWYGYHDRNFGRFYWGNIGWIWFVLNAKERNNNWTYVLHRSNDNTYSKIGSPLLFIFCNNRLRKIFLGNTVNIEIKWQQSNHVPPVLPGNMASIFSDRSLLLPQQLLVKASDEKDYVFLKMNVQTSTELIVPDSEKKQYTFLKELSGSAETIQYLKSKKSNCKKGFFYAEHVH